MLWLPLFMGGNAAGKRLVGWGWVVERRQMFISHSPLARGVFALFTSTVLCASAIAGGEGWLDNFEQAKKTAAAEGKDLLIDFTGSDWCGWCIKLNEEVFSKAEFKAAGPKKFVLVELDFPQKKKLADDVKAQNEKLQKEFSVRGFPTIFLADASGRPYAQTGYQQGGPEAYLKHLAELQEGRVKRDAAWKDAQGAQGVAKAQLLATGLKTMDEDFAAKFYKTVVDEIIALDPKDETGVVSAFGFKSDMAALQQSLGEAGGKGDASALRPVVDKFLADHPKATAEQKQTALMGILSFCQPPKDNLLVKNLMAEVEKIDAKTEMGQRAGQILKRVEQMITEEAAKGSKAKGDDRK